MDGREPRQKRQNWLWRSILAVSNRSGDTLNRFPEIAKK
jgi:hypothetical protein